MLYTSTRHRFYDVILIRSNQEGLKSGKHLYTANELLLLCIHLLVVASITKDRNDVFFVYFV